MADIFAQWVNLPTSGITALSTAGMEEILAAGLAMIVFALGFMAGQQR